MMKQIEPDAIVVVSSDSIRRHAAKVREGEWIQYFTDQIVICSGHFLRNIDLFLFPLLVVIADHSQLLCVVYNVEFRILSLCFIKYLKFILHYIDLSQRHIYC
jgi:hypothetical protein